MTTLETPGAVMALQSRARQALADGCQHYWNGRCWLCSDERPVWREMRLSMGLPAYPPLNPPRRWSRLPLRYRG